MSTPNRNDSCLCGSGKKYKYCCLKRDDTLASSKSSVSTSVPTAMQTAMGHHQAGRLPQAETIYRQILQVEPSQPDALHFLGLIAFQAGKNEIAVELISKAIRINPTSLMHYNLGLVLRSQGNLDAAVESYCQALLLKPNYAEAHNNLGNVLKDQGKLDEAIQHYRKALLIKPDDGWAHNNLGNTLKDQGRLDEAVQHYRKALMIKPDYVEALNNLGNALRDQGEFDTAIGSYRKALALKPDFAEAYNNLGYALREQGKSDAAIESFRQALLIKPGYAEAHNNLGNALRDQGKFDAAVESYRKALALKPDFAKAHTNMGDALRMLGKLDEAVECCRKALLLEPDFAEAHNNLGSVLAKQCKLDEAVACYQKALALKPDYAEAYSNLLFNMQYSPKYTQSEIFDEHMHFAEQFEAPLKQFWPIHKNARESKKRLKIGYISGDFRKHSVAYFIEPILVNHNKSQVEVFCYYNNIQYDSTTDRIIAVTDHWIPCKGLSDEQLAERIRNDGIDILVDLSGHTAHNRLPAFARKPAPVQVTWLGYPSTTGLQSIDYILCDQYVAPPEEYGNFAEKPWHLPDSYLCFMPPRDDDVPVESLPFSRMGYITFGCFNNLTKMSDAVVELWGRILHAVPDSRLFIKAYQLNDIPVQQATLERFAAHGINPDRLLLEGWASSKIDALACYNRVDIALDPFPYNGTTTTVEALWMCVPVLTTRGDRFLSRVGESILQTVGLPECVAEYDDYVAKAVAFAHNPEFLTKLRPALRSQLLVSPLCDAILFTRNLEAAFRSMWRVYCR